MADDDFEVSPGRQRDAGARSYRKAATLAARVSSLSRKAGQTAAGRGARGRGTGHRGRGRSAALARRTGFERRVLIKARVVRHRGTPRRSAPLARHIRYLGREGTMRDGTAGRMFSARADAIDGDAFAARCEDDRHHFRFIISPEDAIDMADLRTFTRELMEDMAHDLRTRLDWAAIDHWNTDNPHVHVLVRGVASDGQDLIIDRAYISRGLRSRAEERVTAELGPRSEREIHSALTREVGAERWTSLDLRLQGMRSDQGTIDLHPAPGPDARRRVALLIGRAQVLERMGLARRTGAASWDLRSDLEPVLRVLGERGDIIKTMHRALSGQKGAALASALAVHQDPQVQMRVTGRLVERGLHNELTGEAYAIIEGLDGRAHYLRFGDLDATGDARSGGIVASSFWTDQRGRSRASLQVRSDLTLEEQIGARGAAWLDRQLVSPQPEPMTGRFGQEVTDALDQRIDALVDEGLAQRQGGRAIFARNLLGRLRERELAETAEALGARYGLPWNKPAAQGDLVAGIYRERVTLASGRYAMIDNGLGFQLVPWRLDLERHRGMAVTGVINARGGVDWSFGRSRGPSR